MPSDATRGTIRRVVVTGAESTGKTTMAQALAAHYKTTWAPEYLRQFVDEQGRLPLEADIPRIAEGHLEQEQRLLRRAYRVLFLDTDLISTCVYHRYYFGEPPIWVEEAAAARRADLYLLMNTDLVWKPDPGQRDGPAVQAATHRLFAAAMKNLPHAVIAGTHAERFNAALQHVERLLGKPTAGPSRSESPHDAATSRA